MGFFIRLLISILVAFFIAVYVHEQESHRTSLYDEWIWEAAVQWDVDPYLIKAVIWRETEFNPKRVGKAKERGLMQVTPVAANEWATKENVRRFKLDDLFDPRTNITAGTWYLARALRHWKNRDNPIPFALSEYNAGRSNVLRWVAACDTQSRRASTFIEQITFPSTKAYVTAIMAKHADYRSAAGHDEDKPGTSPGFFPQEWKEIEPDDARGNAGRKIMD